MLKIILINLKNEDPFLIYYVARRIWKGFCIGL